ncbi:zinc finger MYND domain-containing protein 15 [Rhinophrynus dorsalis]
MDFTRGYQDTFLEFSQVIFSWYKRYLLDCGSRLNSIKENQKRDSRLSNLPYDSKCWIVYLMHYEDYRFHTEIQGGSNNVLSLPDIDKYISVMDMDGQQPGRSGSDDDTEDLCQIGYMLLVAEETGVVLGIDYLMSPKPDGKSEQQTWGIRAYHLLCQCMERPMGAGTPRKPKWVAVGHPDMHAFLSKHLPPLGVQVHKDTLKDWNPNTNFIFSPGVSRSCHICKKRSFEATLAPWAFPSLPTVVPCPDLTPLSPSDRCRAVLYCSDTCKQMDWEKCPNNISHEYWCHKMQQYMQREAELAQMPFLFSEEVTSPSFDKERFLSSHQLTTGYWSVESIHHLTNCLLLKRYPRMMNVDWKEYYDWRGLKLDNPISALLTYPLTIYHVINTLMPQQFPELNILKKKSLKIHILQANREYERILLFWELAVLMPSVSFELVFVVEEHRMDEDDKHLILHKQGSDVLCSNFKFMANDRAERVIHVKVHASPYHTLQASKPDLVIGFNPGFALNDTWLSTLPRLQSLGVPAYFLDCSQYSCDIDGQVVAMATGGSASPPTINPFRSPLRILASDNFMPWYNNAFLYYLIYKSAQHGTNHRCHQRQPVAAPAPPPEPATDPPATRKKKTNQTKAKKRK